MLSISQFQKIIWGYYRRNGRDLPWRHTRDPYRILVSEIMLQQTQVSRVIGFYERFIKQFPDFEALANAKTADVLRAWQGLGYNRRALALQRLAKEVIEKYAGRLPRGRAELESLPGVGNYTAGAIRTFAFNEPEVFIETNIRRVFIRFFFPKKRKVRDEEIRILIQKTMPKNLDPGHFSNPESGSGRRTRNSGMTEKTSRIAARWYYALMDYGAMLGATGKNNPNRRSAHYAKQSKFAGSDRELRGKLLRLLLERKKIPSGELMDIFPESEDRIMKIAGALAREGFILRENIC